MAKKLILGLIMAQIWSPKFLSWILPLLDVLHCYKLSLYAISRKTNEPNLTKWQKTLFRTRFWPPWPKFRPPQFFLWIFPLLDVIHCGKLSLYVISRKTNEPNLRKWQKMPFRTPFWPIWPKFWLPNFFFFFKNLALSVTR